MESPPPFRVIGRRRAVLIGLAVVAAGAFVLWLGLGWAERYGEYLAGLENLPSEQASAELARQLKRLAIAQIAPLALFCGYMLWYAHRAIRTQSLPPAGSWIVAGQRIRRGADAVRIARLLLVLAAALLIIGAAEVAYVWRIAVELARAGAPGSI
jgi:hypothetical protein